MVDDGIRSYDAGSILADAQRVMHSGFLQFAVVAGTTHKHSLAITYPLQSLGTIIHVGL